MFVSIVTAATPLADKPWGQSNRMTASALMRIAEVGGPRCCKRNSYIAIAEGVRFAKQELGIEMELGPITCTTSKLNNQCIGGRCPFN